LDRARREADRRSQLLGGVTRAAPTMNALDPDRILTALVCCPTAQALTRPARWARPTPAPRQTAQPGSTDAVIG
jgi:hypothetical protein